MIGEATRIPIVQERARQVFQKESVSRTLNSLEAVARGCSLQAAMLSPLFKVSDYEVQEYNAYPVSISYSFFPVPEGEQVKVITKELFSLGSSFPSTKTITFDNKKGGMDLLVHYTAGTPLLLGIPAQVAQYKIKEGKAKHNNTKVSFILRVSNNIHQIPCLESAEIQEEWEEETKIPIKKDIPTQPAQPAPTGDQPDGQAPADGAQQQQQEAPKQEFEIKKKQKKTQTALNIDSSSHAIPPLTKTNYINQEAEWFKQDKQILEFKAIRNELESYAYDLKNSIGDYGSNEKYIDPSIRQEFLGKLQQAIDWIYSDGQTAPNEEYRKKLNEFKIIGSPVKARARFHDEFPVYHSQFQNFLQDINERLANSPGLYDKYREDIINKTSEMSLYFNQIVESISKKQLFEDSGYNVDEVLNKLEAFKITVNTLFTQPPPKQDPPKAADPAQQQQEQQQPAPDTEMNEEIPSGQQ